jgi:hypothetical protein
VDEKAIARAGLENQRKKIIKFTKSEKAQVWKIKGRAF